MTTRRACIVSLIGMVGAAAAANASTWGDVMKVGPRPKLIRGHPDKVDFGHGLLIPMSEDAFHTLWEGDDRWITYGHGFGHDDALAMGQAEEAAIGTMKLMLLTLAFAPDRLVRVDGGGWRLKSGNVADLVRGDIALPGRPLMPTTDYFNGFVKGESGANSADAAEGATGPSSSGEGSVHATTGWLIWKKDVTLDYVRSKAQLL